MNLQFPHIEAADILTLPIPEPLPPSTPRMSAQVPTRFPSLEKPVFLCGFLPAFHPDSDQASSLAVAVPSFARSRYCRGRLLGSVLCAVACPVTHMSCLPQDEKAPGTAAVSCPQQVPCECLLMADDGQGRINLLSTLFVAANKRAFPYNCFNSLGDKHELQEVKCLLHLNNILF